MQLTAHFAFFLLTPAPSRILPGPQTSYYINKQLGRLLTYRGD